MGGASPGARVAIIGAGGIGFDVARVPAPTHGAATTRPQRRSATSGASTPQYATRGGLKPRRTRSRRRAQVWLLQRKDDARSATGLAKTTGWIRRTLLKKRGVTMLAGVEYERIDDAGLHIRVDGKPQVLAVDTIVVCAGQEPRRELVAGLEAAGVKPTLIGGADVASRARRQARDRAGDRGRAGALTRRRRSRRGAAGARAAG